MAYKLTLDKEKCDSCGFCVSLESKLFEYYNGEVSLEDFDDEKTIENSRVIKRLKDLANACPKHAVKLERVK